MKTVKQLKNDLTLVLLSLEDIYLEIRELIESEYDKEAKDVNLKLIHKLKDISEELKELQ